MELMEIEEVQQAPKTELAPVERAALALESSKTEKHLLALATKHASITVVKDRAGREQAHGAYIEVMRARTAVEKAAKEAREDATKFSKAVIAEAARLVAIVEPEEARLKEARDVWDEEQARIKAEAEARERARILAITERITAIKSYVVLANNCRTSERVRDLQTKLSSIELTGFEEFAEEAVQAHADTLAHLESVWSSLKAQEVEAARIKAEQEAEAARLKAERDKLAAERAELALLRAALEEKNKPAEPEPVFVVMPPEPAFAELAKPVDVPPGVTLIKGEVGTVDAGIAFIPPIKPKAPAPVASAIVQAVAVYWDTDTKTAARWITERAAEIETLKG